MKTKPTKPSKTEQWTALAPDLVRLVERMPGATRLERAKLLRAMAGALVEIAERAEATKNQEAMWTDTWI